MTAATKRGKKAQATRSSLMEAALEVMSRKGYAAATIDEIAQEAGASKGLAYYHFENKEEFAAEILEERINGLVGSFDAALEDAHGGEDQFETMIAAFCNVIADDCRFARFYLSARWCEDGVDSENLREAEARLAGRIAEQLDSAKAEGRVREDIDVQFAAVMIIGLVLTTATRYLANDDAMANREAFVRNVVDFVTNATAARVLAKPETTPAPAPVEQKKKPKPKPQQSDSAQESLFSLLG